VDWKGRRVAVTGSAGVIGRQLLNFLHERRAVIWSLDLLPLPDDVLGRDVITHYEMDLGQMPVSTLTEFRPEVIFHLAASFERSTETPDFWDENYPNNVVASHRIVEVAQQCSGVQVFLFASSYLVYAPELYLGRGSGELRKLKETDLVGPRNLCGSAKYYTEGELGFVSRIGGYRSIFARIYRVFGRGSRDVISRWVRAALAGQEIDVYADEGRFDYVFADDVAEGMIRLAETSICGPVNLTSGRARRVSEVIGALKHVFPNLKVRNLHIDMPIEGSEGDITKLVENTGWRPQITVEQGIQKVLEYEKHRAETVKAHS